MKDHRRLSDDDLTTIVALRERGWSYVRIGKKLNMSSSAISYHCLRLAAEPPKPAKCWDGVRGPATMVRNGFVLRRFTPEEDARLLELEREGKKVSQIAKALGRHRNSIQGRLMTLARRQERASA
ncbi:MAG TPA: helix-turn-helix domain-containing protein [Methylocystis sp.]